MRFSDYPAGKCARRNIQCVLFDSFKEQVACGYNGPLHGTCECPGKDVPAGSGGKVDCYSMHAEAMALAVAHYNDEIHSIRTCICTKAPCRACTLLLLGTPCQEILFLTPSNETENRELWEAAGRTWRQVTESELGDFE